MLADVRRLLLEDGDQLAATERTRALQGPLVESYQPLADLLIRSSGEARDYRRSLDLRTGIVGVDYTVDGIRFRRETYVSDAGPGDGVDDHAPTGRVRSTST